MHSIFHTPKKSYVLNAAPFTCNKFGIAEFIVRNYCINNPAGNAASSVLDVGCGVGPLGIFFADQYNSHVIGIDINGIAIECCKQNLKKLNLSNKFELYQDNFLNYIDLHQQESFDIIVSNPPVDLHVSSSLVQQYAEYDFSIIRDPQSYAYITNSWHSINGLDLIDCIFHYAQSTLKPDGRIILGFCTIGGASPDFIEAKAHNNHLTISEIHSEIITSECLGLSFDYNNIMTYYMVFKRG